MSLQYKNFPEDMEAYLLYTTVSDYQDRSKKTVATNDPLTLDDTINFGKHKGKLVAELIETEPDYVRWMIDNNVRSFAPDAEDLISSKGIA